MEAVMIFYVKLILMTLNGVGCEYLLWWQLWGRTRERGENLGEFPSVIRQHPVYKGCQHKILFSGTQPCPAIRISEIPGTLEIAADEEQNNLVLFSLPLRVSTRVNKQLKCSFSRRVEIRNRQMEGLFHFMFDLQLQSTTNGTEFNISGVCCQLSPVCMW